MDRNSARPPDNHVHTRYSWDTPGTSTMQRACERAVAEGLPAIAFTEHLDFTVWLDEDRATADGLIDRHPAQQTPIDVEAYLAELEECRDRFPELRIWSAEASGLLVLISRARPDEASARNTARYSSSKSFST